MDIDDKHRYAASSVLGMSLLGEGALIFEMSPVSIFSFTLLGGVAGIYVYGYSRGGKE